MTERSVQVASCGDCSWTGRRRWPSPIKPCPNCGGTFIGRVTAKRNKWIAERHTPWEQTL